MIDCVGSVSRVLGVSVVSVYRPCRYHLNECRLDLKLLFPLFLLPLSELGCVQHKHAKCRVEIPPTISRLPTDFTSRFKTHLHSMSGFNTLLFNIVEFIVQYTNFTVALFMLYFKINYNLMETKFWRNAFVMCSPFVMFNKRKYKNLFNDIIRNIVNFLNE